MHSSERHMDKLLDKLCTDFAKFFDNSVAKKTNRYTAYPRAYPRSAH